MMIEDYGLSYFNGKTISHIESFNDLPNQPLGRISKLNEKIVISYYGEPILEFNKGWGKVVTCTILRKKKEHFVASDRLINAIRIIAKKHQKIFDRQIGKRSLF